MTQNYATHKDRRLSNEKTQKLEATEAAMTYKP